MKRNHLSPLLLALVLVATAAQAAGSAPASPAAPAPVASVAVPAAVIAATPAVTSPALPAWDPVILAGLPAPVAMKSELPAEFLPPSVCPPPCIGCIAPHRCVAPCQTTMGCTICSCS